MAYAADSTGRATRALTTRSTAEESRANLAAMLRLCEKGKVRCSEKTRRPSAATIALVNDVLRDGDFYPGARDDFRGNWGAEDLDSLSRYDGLTAIRCPARSMEIA